MKEHLGKIKIPPEAVYVYFDYDGNKFPEREAGNDNSLVFLYIDVGKKI